MHHATVKAIIEGETTLYYGLFHSHPHPTAFPARLIRVNGVSLMDHSFTPIRTGVLIEDARIIKDRHSRTAILELTVWMSGTMVVLRLTPDSEVTLEDF